MHYEGDDGVPFIPAIIFEETFGGETPQGRAETDEIYASYNLSDLEDGTFLEVPQGTKGNLLYTRPDGSHFVGGEALMEYRSYFLGTAEVEGASTRVLWGVFGDERGIDSYVTRGNVIICRIIPSEATHPLDS